MLSRIGADVRRAARHTLRMPLFSTAVVVTMAIGLSAAATSVTIGYHALVKPLPYRDADRLVNIRAVNANQQIRSTALSAAEFSRVQTSAALADVAYSTDVAYTLTGAGGPLTLMAYQLSANFLPLLGVRPAIGRVFLPGDALPGNDRVALLSDHLWRNRFGADAAIVGRTITLDGRPFRVIGVMPPEFRHPLTSTDLWTPMRIEAAAEETWDPRYLRVVGRLRDEASIETVARQLAVLSSNISREHPRTNAEWRLDVRPLRDMYVGDIRVWILVLVGGSVLLLVLAYATIGGLFTSRVLATRRNVAVRLALGADPVASITPLLCEAVLLSTAGACAGLLVSGYAVAGLPLLLPRDVVDAALAGTSLRWTGALGWMSLSVGVGAAMSVLAARRTASDRSLTRVLAHAGSAGGPPARHVAHSALVVAQVAMAVMLMVGGALMGRSMMRLRQQSLGVDTGHVLVTELTFPAATYGGSRQSRFLDAVLDRLKATPGIVSAGATNVVPLSGMGARRTFRRSDDVSTSVPVLANFRLVSPDYFRAVGMHQMGGRAFNATDRAGAPDVVIVNETLARLLAARGTVVGAQLVTADYGTPSPKDIIGVVNDVREEGFDGANEPTIYRPLAQAFWPVVFIVARTTGDPDLARPLVQRALAAEDPNLPVASMRTFEAMARSTTALRRLVTTLLGAGGIGGFLVAIFGLYALVAYEGRQRRTEIAVRRALGAPSLRIWWLVGSHGLSLVVLGELVGIPMALLASSRLERLLFEVSVRDPLSVAGVGCVVLTTAIAACVSPAVIHPPNLARILRNA